MSALIQSLHEVHTMMVNRAKLWGKCWFEPVDPLALYIRSHRTWKTQDSGSEMEKKYTFFKKVGL